MTAFKLYHNKIYCYRASMLLFRIIDHMCKTLISIKILYFDYLHNILIYNLETLT
jgi:hypothetical protein